MGGLDRPAVCAPWCWPVALRTAASLTLASASVVRLLGITQAQVLRIEHVFDMVVGMDGGTTIGPLPAAAGWRRDVVG